jgi:pilus assembly protein CpaB
MQNRRGLIFLTLAVAMGVAAAKISTQMVEAPSAEGATAIDMATVVVTRTDVAIASELTQEHLETIEWPAAHLPPGALNSVDLAVGRIARRPLSAGEAVTLTALFDAGAAGGLRAVIAKDKRAVSVKVDNVISVAGFVTPGSRVDVLATIRRVDLERALPFSKVILQDIKVLAVDQKLEEAKAGDPELVNVVTLEVNPVQAEHLIYSAHEGRLQLALRSPGDHVVVPNVSIGVRDVLGKQAQKPTQVAKNSYVPRTRPSVQLISGSKVQVKRF